MQATVMAGALVIIIAVQVRVTVAGLEVRAMVGSIEDNCIIIQAFFFQL